MNWMSLVRPTGVCVRRGTRFIMAVASGLVAAGAAVTSMGVGAGCGGTINGESAGGVGAGTGAAAGVGASGVGAGTGAASTGGVGAAGTGGLDGGVGAGAGAAECTGQCVEGGPLLWTDPELVWIGPPAASPSCPTDAPKVGFNGYADLDAPSVCGPCTCGPSAGTCALPNAIIPSTQPCSAGDSGTFENGLVAPPGWDGGCAVVNAMPAEQGIASLTIQPLSRNEACPQGPPSPLGQPPATWQTMLMTCRDWPGGVCAPGSICIAPTPAVSGFRVCIGQMGEASCSGPDFAPYTEQHVVYTGFTDTRSCTCTCGAVAGSSCSSTVSVYDDAACGDSPGVVEEVTSPGANVCQNVAPGMAIGSISATTPVYTPGMCVASGEPVGAAVPTGPTTFCCIPPP